MEVSNPFWDIRGQDFTDSGPNGYHLTQDIGTTLLRKSPFGLGNCIRLKNSSLKLANTAHHADFQAFCKRTSWTMFFASVLTEEATGGGDRGPLFYCGGTVLSAAPENNFLFAHIPGNGNILTLGGEYGGGGIGYELIPLNLPIHHKNVVAVTKRPASAGKIVYKLHDLEGVFYTSGEHIEPDEGSLASVRLGVYTGLTQYLEADVQQLLFTEDLLDEQTIRNTLSMII